MGNVFFHKIRRPVPPVMSAREYCYARNANPKYHTATATEPDAAARLFFTVNPSARVVSVTTPAGGVIGYHKAAGGKVVRDGE